MSGPASETPAERRIRVRTVRAIDTNALLCKPCGVGAEDFYRLRAAQLSKEVPDWPPCQAAPGTRCRAALAMVRILSGDPKPLRLPNGRVRTRIPTRS